MTERSTEESGSPSGAPAQSMMPIKGGEGGMAGGKFEESSDRVANVYHRPKNGIPGRRGLEDGVGEHAAVPADVLDPAGLVVLEPVLRAFHDVEFPVRIVGLAVLAGLVVAPGPVDGAVVLGDVKVDRPG